MRHFSPRLQLGLAAALALLPLLAGCGKQDALYLYCGAGIREAVADAIEVFSRETKVPIEADYSGSETLLASIKLNRTGDLYMPGDVHYIEQAAAEGLVESQREICYFIPVILVQEGNPKGIRGLSDLLRPGVKLGLGDPRSCAIGRLCEKIFEKNNIPREAVQASLTFSSPTVNLLGLQIQTGHVDAVIVWDAIAKQYEESGDVVAIAPEQNIISHVAIAVLRTSTQPKLAASFVDFLTSERGRAIFEKHHYTTSLATP